MRDKVKYPKDWRLLSIASLVDNNKDLFDDGDWIEAEYLTDSGIRLIQTGNVGEGTFVDKDKKKYISEQSFTKLKCKELNVGDILICRLADPAGRACILPDIGEEKMITSVDVSIYRPRANCVDRGFLVASMSTANWFNEIRERCGGSTRTRIARSELGKMKIPLPPLPEQKAIAQVLSTADAAIHTTEKLIAQKELRKKWLMQQLLTGKKRLKGFEGEWREVHLGEMFTERNETKCFDLPLLSIGQNGVYPQDESVKKDTSNEDKSKYKRICPGDIGYNTMRMWQGRSALSELEGIVSPAYTVVTPKKNADSVFFSYLFKMPRMTNLFWRNSQGLVDDTLNCKFKDFSIVKVMLPQTKEEQTAIAKVLQAADKEISLLKAKANRLREQKKGLMQVLLTGKKRIVL